MAIKPLIFQSFTGGLSTDPKMGIKYSQAYIEQFDFRKSPSQMSVLPGLTREDQEICNDLVVNEVMIPNGTIYAFGNLGSFYKRTTAGVWSIEGSLSSSGFGMDYRQDADSIYLTESKSVSLYNPITGTGTPTMTPGKYGISFSTYNNSENAGFNVSSYQVNSNASTLINTAISEGSAGRRYFQTDIEPLNKVSVFIKTKGTGNWTLTLHDGLDNVLGTSTVTNANLTSAGWNDFTFPNATNEQVRLYVAPNARTYHFHLTSTVADGTVSSINNNDLSSCDLMIYADRLVKTQNGLHPMQRFLQYETIGNGNYLSTWEPLEDPPSNTDWQRHRLVFPQEYEVCGLAVLNEYLAIACEKPASGSNIPQDGVIFWWDGYSPTYNYITFVPEGAPQGIREYKNVVYYFAGGAEYAIVGANSVPMKIRTMPGTDTEFSGANANIQVYPYTATTRRGIHLIGYPSATTNTDIDFGVYSWGAVDKNYPESFGYSYVLANGTKNYSVSNNLKIGMVKNFGDILHVSWRDDLNGVYGVDVITNASKPAASAVWESLIFDSGYVAKEKSALYMEAYYTLPAGASIRLKYKIDRATDWTYSDAYTSTSLWQGNPNYARFNLSEDSVGRFREAQIGLEITCDATVTTPPVVQMASLIFDDNSQEQLD